jgi:hypothetical protein
MLRGIRVSSKEEFAERIYQYFNDINEEPVVFRWKYKMYDISVVKCAKLNSPVNSNTNSYYNVNTKSCKINRNVVSCK